MRDELAALLEWVWTVTLEADWPRRQRILQADVVSRTSTLATRGWSAVVASLGSKRQWLGDGRLQINGYDLPDRDLQAAEQLWFIPVHSNGSWVAWEEPTRYAIVYPVTGSPAPPTVAGQGATGRLIGTNRARLLAALAEPKSTTQLAALSGLPKGAVGNHLRILLESGLLLLLRRAGRDVLYWRTALGDALVATGQADHAPPERSPARRNAPRPDGPRRTSRL